MPNPPQSLPIFTFTANLVAETTYYVPDWAPGQTRRATRERFQVGGKGINVSKMLQRLGADATALCFPGGSFGPMCLDWLDAQDIPYRAFGEGCVTRSGSVIRAPGKDELSILGLDSVVSDSSLQACLEHLESIEFPYVLAICGVIPNWESPVWESFRAWLQKRPRSVMLAVDTYGPALEWLAGQSPDLVKINGDELALLLADSTAATEALLKKASQQFACPLWIITDGEKPIWYRSGDAAPLSLTPPSVECRSATGCGDVFFATLLAQLYGKPHGSLDQALALATDYAARNAASEGIADFHLASNNIFEKE